MRKIFSLFAALTLSVGLWAQDGYGGFTVCIDAEHHFNYEITSDDEVKLISIYWYGGTDIDLVIPSTATTEEGVTFNVTGIGYQATTMINEQIAHITIPASIKSIDDWAFQYCRNLSSVTFLGDACQYNIGDWAFSGAVCMTLTLPDTWNYYERPIEELGGHWHGGTFSSVEYTKTHPDNYDRCIFYTATSELSLEGDYSWSELDHGFEATLNKYWIEFPDDESFKISTEIPWGIFNYDDNNKTALKNIQIPAFFTKINENAFSECINLDTITFAESSLMETIESGAFNGCTALKHIVIPEKVTQLNSYIFQNCVSLTTITISASVTKIGNWAFTGCSSLQLVTIENASCEIDDWAFDGLGSAEKPITLFLPSDWPTTDLPNEETFWWHGGYFKLGAITDSSKCIWYEAPAKVTLPTAWNTLVHSKDATSGKYWIQLTDDITKVIDGAFWGTNITSVTIPEQIETIGANAFCNCYDLTTITFAGNSNLTTIEGYAFSESNLTSFTMPAGVTSVGEQAFSTYSMMESLYILDLAKWCNISFSDNYSNPLSSANHLFVGDTEVTSLEIPNTVTSIGGLAFAYAQTLLSVTIPASVTSIGHHAFFSTDGLKTVTFAENSALKTIGDYAFASNIYITSITLPATLETIGDLAFNVCPFSTITIPASVKKVGAGAFRNCRELTIVTFESDACKNNVSSNAFEYVGKATNPITLVLPSDWPATDLPDPTTGKWHGGYFKLPTYTRDVTDGSWGTICLPWASVKLEGGDFYDVLGTKDAELGVALVELGESDQLEAGKPYVFKATSEQIKVTYNPATEVASPVDAGNHIIGSFAGCNVPEGMYIIYQDLLYKSNGANTIGEYRAYFDADNMEPYNPATAPARVVFMGGRQTPTRLGGEADRLRGRKVIKVIENGQFRIVRDGKTYNAQGIEL